MKADVMSEARVILCELQSGLAQLHRLAKIVAHSINDPVGDAVFGLATFADALADKAQQLDEALPGADQ